MDFTSLYSTRIKSTFDDDQADILKTFRNSAASKEGSKVILTNYYKGLPIIYPATVVAVEKGNLDLDVNQQQAVAIASDRYTLIRSKLFPDVILSHVQYVNIKKHAVSLNKLCFVEVLAEKRNSVRLDLESPVSAAVQFDEQSIPGALVNISVQGVAIAIDTYAPVETGSDVSVKFMLPDPVMQKQVLVRVPAALVDIQGDASPYLYKFKIFPEKHQEQLVSRYCFQRQVEIIRGLKEVAD